MKKISLFHIGSKFYRESGTRMSSIYEAKTFKRYDWGRVQDALEKGYTVNIRPATKDELESSEQVLQNIKRANFLP